MSPLHPDHVFRAHELGLVSDEEARSELGYDLDEPEIITRRYRKVYRVSAKSWTASGGGNNHDSLDAAMAELRKFVEDGYWGAEITVAERHLP